MKRLVFEQFKQLAENAEGKLVSGFPEAFEANLIGWG